jgi:hypothetical protein
MILYQQILSQSIRHRFENQLELIDVVQTRGKPVNEEYWFSTDLKDPNHGMSTSEKPYISYLW